MKQKVKKDLQPSAASRKEEVVMNSLDLREISKVSANDNS